MPRPVAIIAIFVLSLIGMAVSSSMVSAQTEPSPKANTSSNAFSCEENWACPGWGNCSSSAPAESRTDNSKCEAEINPENQIRMTATGIVSLTILRPPEICGDGKCSQNETCDSCPVDCGKCKVAFGLAGFMTGATGLSLYGLVVIIAIAMLLTAMVFTARKKGIDDDGQYFLNSAS